MDQKTEDYRRECEAREWIKRGYSTPARIKQLRKRITDQRGADAADELIIEMRKQWQLLKKTNVF